jgi:hypothetical protein
VKDQSEKQLMLKGGQNWRGKVKLEWEGKRRKLGR